MAWFGFRFGAAHADDPGLTPFPFFLLEVRPARLLRDDPVPTFDTFAQETA